MLKPWRGIRNRMGAKCLLPAALLLAALGNAAATADSQLFFPKLRLPSFPEIPMIIGHRGLGQAAGNETENSISSLVTAFKRGANAVEFDVQLTADGEVVLAHDPRLERVSDGHGCVSDRTLAEMRELHLKNGEGSVRDERFPSLAEALRAIRPLDSKRRSFLADIHIKVYDGFHGDRSGIDNGGCAATDYKTLASAVHRVVREEGLLHRVIFTSFDPRVLDIIRAESPTARTGLLTVLGAESKIRFAAGRYDAVAINHARISPAKVKYAHDRGLLVFSWSPHDEATIETQLLTDGVDAVIADSIDAARNVVRDKILSKLNMIEQIRRKMGTH